MRLNIISSIANVITRFSVNTADMLRTGNDSALQHWRLELCTAGPLSGRDSRTGLLLGNASSVIRKHGYLPVASEPKQARPEQVSGHFVFQRLS